MGETITIRTGAATEVIKVIEAGPQGPAGPAGTGLETLIAPGDTLYRGQTTGERLPIGSAGQVLKVVNGFPAWAAESGAVTSVNGRTGAVQVSDFGADPQIVVGATTINGSFSLSFQAPHTAYEVPRPTRLSANQRGITRLFVDRPFADADITLTLPTGGGVQNGDIVEVYNLITLSGRKAIINTQGFGTFELYSRQSAFFVYSANTGPARWLRSYDNQFLSTVPNSPSSTSGEIGDMAFDSRFLYVKVPVVVGGGITGSWRRVAWASWDS
jgi:hypothetical protein